MKNLKKVSKKKLVAMVAKLQSGTQGVDAQNAPVKCGTMLQEAVKEYKGRYKRADRLYQIILISVSITTCPLLSQEERIIAAQHLYETGVLVDKVYNY